MTTDISSDKGWWEVDLSIRKHRGEYYTWIPKTSNPSKITLHRWNPEHDRWDSTTHTQYLPSRIWGQPFEIGAFVKTNPSGVKILKANRPEPASCKPQETVVFEPYPGWQWIKKDDGFYYHERIEETV